MRHIVFVVEDEPNTRELYAHWLDGTVDEVRPFPAALPCLAALEEGEPSAVVLDLGLPDLAGLTALARIRALRPELPVIIVTGDEDARTGVRAMQQGAASYLFKPADRDELVAAVQLALRRAELQGELRALRARLTAQSQLHEIVGQSIAHARLVSRIGMVLENDVPVHVTGESGTGKELIARAIHGHGPRAAGPFVAVNCGAVPRDLQESQFFGHEKGAFTGALRRHTGYFEEAHGGTILLDEVGELTPEAQVKLLRALQERRIRRVGGDREITIDVRVISATNRDLREMMAAGTFREDLYYRLVVFPLAVPPLRERPSDIALLCGHLLRQFAEQVGSPVPAVTDAALDCLVRHPWPGNVRELQNALQFALLAAGGAAIAPQHLPPEIADAARLPAPGAGGPALPLLDPLTGRLKSFARLEREIYEQARAIAGGSIARAARLLEVGRTTLYRHLQDEDDAAPPPEERPATNAPS